MVQEEIHIALTTDDNYAQHTAVVIASILKNSRALINFYIVSDGLLPENRERISKTAQNLNAHKIDFINIGEVGFDFNQLYISGHIHIAAYYRLALPYLLPETIDKVIYLDTDLVVLDDIQILWSMDLDNYPLGAVADYGIMSSKKSIKNKMDFIDIAAGDDYFNSGVLLLNLKVWREHNYTAKLIDLIRLETFQHHDQDALNKVFKNNWLSLPLKWNVIPPIFYLLPKLLMNSRFRKSAIEAKKNISILHYAGRNKPWQFKLHKGFNDQYYFYLSFTAFKDNAQIKYKKESIIYRQLLKLFMAKLWVKIF